MAITSGLGIPLVRALMDGLDYAREGETNHLTLRRQVGRIEG